MTAGQGSSAGAIILSIAYGYTIEPPSSGRPDPLVALAKEGIAQISYAAQPGAFLVDVRPFCAHPVFRFWLPCILI